MHFRTQAYNSSHASALRSVNFEVELNQPAVMHRWSRGVLSVTGVKDMASKEWLVQLPLHRACLHVWRPVWGPSLMLCTNFSDRWAALSGFATCTPDAAVHSDAASCAFCVWDLEVDIHVHSDIDDGSFSWHASQVK